MEEPEKTAAAPAEAPAVLKAEAETEAAPRLGFFGGVIFVCILALDTLRIYLHHYTPFQRLANYSALHLGAEPAGLFFDALAAEILSLLLFWRLALALIPTSSPRRRWLTTLLGFPLAIAGAALLELSLIGFIEHFSDNAEQLQRLALILLASAGAAGALAAFVALGLGEGAPEFRRGFFPVFIRLLPLAVLMGALAVSLCHLSQVFLVLPFIGPPLQAGFNLGLQLWLIRTLARMIRTGRPLLPADPPELPLALPAGILTGLTLLFCLILPGPPYHFNARTAPPLVPAETRIAASNFDDRGKKVTFSSQRLMVVVGQDPFEFAVVDQNRKVLLKLLTDPDRDPSYRGVATNLEYRAMRSFPLSAGGLLVESRFLVRSQPVTSAGSLRLSAGELIAESQVGGRPVVVSFSFVDENVLKIVVDAGARLAFHSNSIAFSCGEHERFYGLGSLGGSDLRGRDLDLTLEDGYTRWSYQNDFPRRLTRGRIGLSIAAGGRFWPAPMLYLSRGIGLFLAETVDPRIELASRYPDAIRFSGKGGPLVLYLVAGPTPTETIGRMRLLIGPRAPTPPEALLPWVTLDQPGAACGNDQTLAAIRQQKLPAGYVLLYREAMGGEGQCPGLKPFLAAGRKLGYRFVYQDSSRLDVDGALYHEAARRGYLVMNRVGLPYRLLTTHGSRTIVDFTNPQVLQWRAQVWRRLRTEGFDGVVLDPLALLPPESMLYNGESGYIMRNSFPTIYAEGVAGALGPEAVLVSPIGFTGMERQVAVMKPRAHAEVSLPLLAALSLSGAPEALLPSGEEAAGFLPLMSLPLELLRSPGESGRDPLRRAVETHARLLPYFSSLLARGRERGEPLMLPPGLGSPGEDFGVHAFLLGEGLLVTVPPPGAQQAKVIFPPGGWRQLETLRYYGGGPREVAVTGGPSAFLGEGRILPLLTESPPLRPDQARGPFNDLTLLLSPGPEAVFNLFDGALLDARRAPDALVLTVAGATDRAYTWRILDVPKPAAVYREGVRQPPASWTYQERTRVLTIPAIKGKEHRLEVVTPDEIIIDPSLQPPEPRQP